MALKFARTTSFTRKLKFERSQYLDHKGKSQQLTVWEEVCWTHRHVFLSKGSSLLLFVDFVWKKNITAVPWGACQKSHAILSLTKRLHRKVEQSLLFCFVFLSKWSKVVLRFNIQTWGHWPRELQHRKRKCHGSCG